MSPPYVDLQISLISTADLQQVDVGRPRPTFADHRLVRSSLRISNCNTDPRQTSDRTKFQRRRGRMLALLVGLAQLTVLSASCDAESLNEALVKTYASNPTILAARAGQRATDELVPQALSAWQPTVTLDASTSHEWVADPAAQAGASRQMNGEIFLTLQQPIFRGYSTVEGVKSARARVESGEQQLTAIEQSVLLGAVEAYMSVYANRRLLELERQNLKAVREQLRGDLQRFKVGEITRTDVSQTQAQVSQAEAALASVVSDLAESEARYLEVIGDKPGQLHMPEQAKQPQSLHAALEVAGQENPALLASAYAEEAARHDIGVARSPLFPQITLQARAGTSDDFLNETDEEVGASVQALLSWQIFSGGETQSAIRQAKETASQRRIDVVASGRAVRQAVTSAWNNYKALGRIVTSAKARVEAERLALSGVEEEYRLGTRTTLDVLNQRQALVAARATQVIAERDRVITSYQLLASMGQLTLSDPRLAAPVDQPKLNAVTIKSKVVEAETPSLY